MSSLHGRGLCVERGAHSLRCALGRAVAGAIASCTREGSRAQLTAIGAGSVNQAVKAVAIARQYVEDEAIDLWCAGSPEPTLAPRDGALSLWLRPRRCSCRPDFVDVEIENDGSGVTSAMRLVLLVEQT